MAHHDEADTPLLDLRLGDCVREMRAVAAESVDVVITSPPYNLGIRYARYRDDAARPRFIEADVAHARKSSIVNPSRLPFIDIWWVRVHVPSGL